LDAFIVIIMAGFT